MPIRRSRKGIGRRRRDDLRRREHLPLFKGLQDCVEDNVSRGGAFGALRVRLVRHGKVIPTTEQPNDTRPRWAGMVRGGVTDVRKIRELTYNGKINVDDYGIID